MATKRKAGPTFEGGLEFQLAKALGHPLRARILSLVNEQPIAPVEAAEKLDEPLPNISYHFRVLSELRCIEVAKQEQVRGSMKSTYRACKRMLIDDADWARLSPQAKAGVTAAAVRQVLDRARLAIDAGSFDKRDDRHLTTTTISVDEEGWVAVMAILKDALTQVMAVETESGKRTRRSSDRFNTTVQILGFESP